MTKRLATLALVSAAVLSMAVTANAQNGSQSSPGAYSDQMNEGGPVTNGQRNGQRNRNLGTVGQGRGAPAQDIDETGNGGNDQAPSGGEGRVNSHQQD